jgi:hypothetical protein
MWRRCFTSGFFHHNLKAIVIDEAHCITEWYVLLKYQSTEIGIN